MRTLCLLFPFESGRYEKVKSVARPDTEANKVPDNRNIAVAVFVEGNEGYGLQRSLIGQYKASKNRGIDFRYVCLNDGQFYKSLLDLGADVKLIGGRIPQNYPPNLFKLLAVFISHLRPAIDVFNKLRAYLKETRPDVLYTHMVTEHILGGLAAKSCGIRSVGHFRCMLNTARNFGLSRLIVSILLNYSLDAGISVSDSAQTSLWGPMRSKTSTIFNGADIQGIYEASQRPPGENCSAPDVVCIGRLASIKKQDILVEALAILTHEGFRVQASFVGGGAEVTNPYFLRLKQLISRLGLKDEIVFTGFVCDPYEMLAKAKVSVLCCLREGSPNIVAESMACRTAVAVADAGGGGELVEDGVTGLKFAPDDPHSLAECLRRLLTDEKLRRKLEENAFAWAKQRFNWDTHVTQLKQRFELALSKRQ